MDNNSQNQFIQIPPDMKVYIESLLNDAGMTELDDTLRNEMVQEIFIRLDKYITSVIIENMKPEDVELFIKMNDEGKSQEEMQTFIKEKIPNAQEVMTNAFINFRELYLGKVTVASANPSDVDSNKLI